MNAVAGVDLGGTQIKAAAFSPAGEILHQCTAPTGDEAGEHPPPFASTVREMLAGLEDKVGERLTRVGISAPGLAAKDGRSIAYMPGRMHGLENWDWPTWLEREATVLNDAQAALLGEVWRGAARGVQDAILLTLGTGVGGAVLSGGRLLRGHLGRAGHFGHVCLDPFGAPTIARMPGGLEDWMGNHNIAARTEGRFATTHELVEAVRVGDAEAGRWWARSVRALGCAIASLVNAIDPEVVLIGGGISRAGDTLFGPLQRVLDEVEWRPAGAQVRLVPAALGEWAGAYGAASAVRVGG